MHSQGGDQARDAARRAEEGDVEALADFFEQSRRRLKQMVALYTFPMRLWREERTMPGLFTALEALSLWVFGSADAHMEDGAGGEWGWRADDTFVDTLGDVVAISPLSGPNGSTRNVQVRWSVDRPAPRVSINTRGGGDYGFHAGHAGTLFQLEVRDSEAKSTDVVELSVVGGSMRSFEFSPQKDAGSLVPKIGFALKDLERVVFKWIGFGTPGGGTLRFDAEPDARGVGFVNGSGSSRRPVIVLEAVDGEKEEATVTLFGPFDVPDEARHEIIPLEGVTGPTAISRVDLDRDGIPEIEETVVGLRYPITANQHLDTGIEANVEFCYRVGAVDDEGKESPLSIQACARAGADGSALFRRGDANGDGALDITDAVGTLGYLFAGGLAPPSPGPGQCGVDPTPDSVGACSYTACQ